VLISIASGKGGTGKTALTLLLAAAHSDINVVDGDVEEPNCHLFLKPKSEGQRKDVTIMVPNIDADRCNGCGACAEVCLFNAIAITGGKALIFDELCHSCGGCMLKCPQDAIVEQRKSIGVITCGDSTTISSTRLMSGVLKIGVPSGVPLIKAIKKEAQGIVGDVLFDCPPGTSCSMVSAVKESDFCILVTEPTSFGKHDLELAMNITQLLEIDTGVVINKSDGGAGDEAIEAICRNRQIPVLAKIPYSLSFAREYSAGIIANDYQAIAKDIWRQIRPGGRAEA